MKSKIIPFLNSTLFLRLLFVSVLTFTFQFLCAQSTKEHSVYVELMESITRRPIYEAHVTLMKADGTLLNDSVCIGKGNRNGILFGNIYFTISEPGKYILKCEKDGYLTGFYDFEIKKLYKHEDYISLDKKFMLKKISKEKTLNEVTVKATKIKFYVRDDTLVYNADAFELQEGSMLDALIKQLPDAELKKGGEIYVRGRRVNELLLNGRDFFDKDRQIILENLPSYMVQNIKVYERNLDDFEKNMIHNNSQKLLSMNIQLKRIYSIGWIANAEAGMGTKETKLARLFALRFTPQSRLSLFANINNLNDDRTPGDNGDWNPVQQNVGERESYKGGLDYNILQKHGYYKINGNLKATYSKSTNKTDVNTENFLIGGNTFGKSFYNGKSYSTNISTNHNFDITKTIKLKIITIPRLVVSPFFSYSNSQSNNISAAATLTEDANRILGSDWKEKIMSLNSSEELRTYGLNRTLLRQKDNGHQLNTGLDWSTYLRAPHNTNLYLYLSGGIKYTDSHAKEYDHYSLNYYKPENTDFRNRHNTSQAKGLEYDISLSSPSQSLFRDRLVELYEKYTFQHRRQKQNRTLYLLNKLDAWGINTEHSLGELPSTNEMLIAFDNLNSYEQTQTDNIHKIEIGLGYSQHDQSHFKKTAVSWSMYSTIRIDNNHFDYFKNNIIDTTFSRTNVFFEPSFQMSIFPAKGNYWDKWFFSINYNLTHNTPQMVYLTGITDTSNPLNIMQGNKSLKNASTHHLETHFTKPLSRKRNINMAASANVYTDKVALGYIYEHNTGVRTITPDNINGNWNAAYSVTYRSRLDKKDRWSYQTATGYTYVNSVDLIGTSATADRAVRSKVGSHYITESALLRYAPSSKTDFYLKGNVNYQNAQSDRDNFKTINVYDFNYGLTARIELPLALQLSTDLTMYSRRGYNDPSMNTNDLVWNARISKRFMHGNLVCMLDAFDLLGNLSNVRRTIDAQGRVETWTNVTPQFALLHVIYRLNKQPKKK